MADETTAPESTTPAPSAPPVSNPILSAAGAAPAPSEADKAKAKADAAVAAANLADPKAKFILYLGPSNAAANSEALKKRKPKLGEGTRAQITPSQWAEQGISASRTLTFGLENNWRVPVTQMTDDQIDYLLHHSTRFKLVDGTGKPVSR